MDMAGAENVHDAIQNDYFYSIPNWKIDLEELPAKIDAALKEMIEIVEASGSVRWTLIEGANKIPVNGNYLNDNIKQKPKEKAYIINEKSWTGLFNNLTGLGHTIEAEKEAFLGNYNNYQYYEILKNINRFI